MVAPQLGYLGLCENPTAEAGRALIRQFVLVREADRMGYDDIWLGEHHGDAVWPSAGVLGLLGHLAGVTSKARIGSMVLQPGLRDARQLAEELATIDLLSKGRLELGVASGAVFAPGPGAAGIEAARARHRLLDTLDTLQAAWQARTDGAAAGDAPVPQPDRPLPIWVAADDPYTLDAAAARGWGLMAAATHTLERVRRACSRHAAVAGRPPPLTLARFACTAATREEAVAIAEPYFRSLAERARLAGWGADRGRSIVRDVDALIAESLVGSHAEVAAQFSAIGRDWGASRIAIVPTSAQFDTHKHILANFVDEVRPLFDY
ncbi:MAG: LLM class flavin-dependent oxidoreductase [Aquabacterium sp.]|nr:MAG: LLM class flavin-dependent oxidoreductase [Aquabacterium sp.]